MPDPLFLAAWTAGIIEGAAEFAQRDVKGDTSHGASEKTHGLTSLLLPSLLYGSLAVPMSIIGESPGPALIRLIQIGTSLTPPSGNNDTLCHPTPSCAESYTKPVTRASSTLRSRSVAKSFGVAETGIALSSQPQVNLLHRVRKENQMTWEDSQNQRLQRRQTATTVMGSKKSVAGNSRNSAPHIPSKGYSRLSWTRYFATLDEQSFSPASPLANLMKRFRIVLVGVGLANWYLQRQQHQEQKQTNTVPALSTSGSVGHAPSISRLADAAKQNNAGGGVVLRLVDTVEDHRRKGIPPGRLPVLNSSVIDLSSASMGILDGLNIASMYRCEEDLLPLSEDWLVRSDQSMGGSSEQLYLIVEANLASPLAHCFGCRTRWLWPNHKISSRNRDNVLEKTIAASQRIDLAAKRKKLLSGTRGTEKEDRTKLVNVLVGSDPDPSTAHVASQKLDYAIYLDGLAALRTEISTLLLESASKVVSREKNFDQRARTEESFEQGRSDSRAGKSENPGTDLLESLGQAIRQIVKFSTSSLTNCFFYDDEKPFVRVISDNPNFAKWLRDSSTMEDLEVVWLDPSDLLLEDEINLVAPRGTTLVCCKNEEETAKVAFTISSAPYVNAEVVALVETTQMELLLNKMILEREEQQELVSVRTKPRLCVKSVEAVHEKLFENVQKLLSAGMTPRQIQDLSHSNPICSPCLAMTV